MRWLNWRRAAALLAIVAGIAVGTTAPASADASQQSQTGTSSTVNGGGGDLWW